MEEAGIRTDRHIVHMKFLQNFQQGRPGPVTDVDLQDIMWEAGPDPELEIPQWTEDPTAATTLVPEPISSGNLSSDEDYD